MPHADVVRATRFLWEAAGRPTPVETDGSPIHPRRVEGVCSSCGDEHPQFSVRQDAISDSFTTVKNASRAWPFGGDSICAACLWCCKAVALRCGMFFARLADAHGQGGILFTPLRPAPGWPTRPDPLAAILRPPPAPFVAGLPLFGIDHGGEANGERALLGDLPDGATWSSVKALVDDTAKTLAPYAPGEDARARSRAAGYAMRTRACPWLLPELAPAWQAFLGAARPYYGAPWWGVATEPLIKLQSKHTAIYCRVSNNAERYHLQVDDAGDVMVDVPLWRAQRAVAEGLLRGLRAAGVGARDAREAMHTLQAPRGTPLSLHAVWSSRVATMRPYVNAPWWRLFADLIPMPALTGRTPDE